jgi:hypothetical protein
LSIWLTCSNSNEVSRPSAQNDELRALFVDAMLTRGFPKAACESLRVLFTSHEDIEAGGGRFYFFAFRTTKSDSLPDSRWQSSLSVPIVSNHCFQNSCDGMRNARLKREDAFCHAMIIVGSAMVSSS